MLYESIKMVLKVFKTNKLRTFLTMLGIIIGIFSITIIFTISDATKESVYNELSEFDTSTIELQFNLYNMGYFGQNTSINAYIPRDELMKLKSTSQNISALSRKANIEFPEYTNIIDSTSQDNSMNYSQRTEFLAVDPDYFEINEKLKNKLLEGRFFSDIDDKNAMPFCIIRQDVAQTLLGTTENLIGRTINVDKHEMEIIGVMDVNTDMYSIDYISDIYILGSYVERYYDSIPQNMSYQFKPENMEVRDLAVEDIKKVLNEYLKESDYYIQDYYASIIEQSTTILDIISLVFLGIASLSILVGGIGIMNIMLVSVNERIKEIGIRIALGAKGYHILIQFLMEGIFLTLFSGIIGIVLAILATNGANSFMIANNYTSFTLKVNLGVMMNTILFCGIIGIVFGIYPAKKASKMNPVEALRYE